MKTPPSECPCPGFILPPNRLRRKTTLSLSRLLLTLALWMILVANNAGAHDVLAAFIQHRVGIVISPKYVDVTVQLTFFEEASEHERAHMDTNRDGILTRAETDAYLREIASELETAVKLRVKDVEVALTPLRNSELDLLGAARTGRGHHRLTAYYFAPAPAQLDEGASFVVEDRLWSDVRAIASMQAEGKDGYRLQALPSLDPVYPAGLKNRPRVFSAKVLAIPARSPSAVTPLSTSTSGLKTVSETNPEQK